jgi:hypothetical protein
MAAKKEKSSCGSGHINNKNANEPVLYKRQCNKINSLACALQLEYSLYDRTTAMRFASISDQKN